MYILQEAISGRNTRELFEFCKFIRQYARAIAQFSVISAVTEPDKESSSVGSAEASNSAQIVSYYSPITRAYI